MDKKTVMLGTFPSDESRKIGRYHSVLHVKVEIQIEQRDGKARLSIMGETYYPGARDFESGGQIDGEVRRLLDAEGAHLNRPREKIARLLEIWDRWHLNDTRAGCEHQRAPVSDGGWDTSAKIQLITYRLRGDVSVKRHATERKAVERLENGETVAYMHGELELVRIPYEVTRGADQLAPPAEYYEIAKREEKLAGWVKPEEHPAGLLCKPCPTCGYKYGTAWLYEPLPADVVKFLEDF